MIPRLVEPELLDSLAPDDPRAIRSRRDLRLINAWMGNARHLARAIRTLATPPKRILELGSGDGTLLLNLLPYFAPDRELWLLDMQPVISSETLEQLRQPRVVRANVLDWLRSSPEVRFDLVIANLFLHHFSDDTLRALFIQVSALTKAFVSCDPRRWRPGLVCTQALWLLGCNSVTRQDARISVRAGFCDNELTRLWPAPSSFILSEWPAGFASHLFFCRAS